MMNKPNPFGDSITTFLTIVFRSFIIFVIAFGIAMIAASIDFIVAVLTTGISNKKEQ